MEDIRCAVFFNATSRKLKSVNNIAMKISKKIFFINFKKNIKVAWSWKLCNLILFEIHDIHFAFYFNDHIPFNHFSKLQKIPNKLSDLPLRVDMEHPRVI